MMDLTPWDELRAVALCLLHWPPYAFWQATPQDLTAALAARTLMETGLSPTIVAGLRDKLTKEGLI